MAFLKMSPALVRIFGLLFLLCITFLVAEGANWAQLAGERAQNTATPYIPDKWHRDQSTSLRPMWSARWGHAVVVINRTVARPYLTDEENSERARGSQPVLVLLGGDDGLPRSASASNFTHAREMGIGSGKLRNDVWIGQLSSGSGSSWRVDDRYFVEGGGFNSDLIRSEMRWYLSNPGRVSPATWPSGRKYAQPMTQEDWIACQDSIQHKLFDPSICNDPPRYCYGDIKLPGCVAQSVFKRQNMWSPRRGHSAAVVDNKIYVIGGQAREYGRIDDARLVGGIAGQKRFETVQEHSTIREDLLLKNDVWVSDDGKGETWKLVTPGCKDHQKDVLLHTEVWSRDLSDPSLRKNVGSIGSKCYLSSDCYGVAECKALSNTYERVCVCPMFSPREHHTVAVQHRFSTRDDGSVLAKDVVYVVGGFTSVKQSFCGNRSCGPSDGYRLALDDAWMSNDGVSWMQFRPAFSDQGSFIRRGSHTALVVHSYFQSNTTEADNRDRLLIFGGETAHPQELVTSYLNDVWQVYLPTEPCCRSDDGCNVISDARKAECLPRLSDWSVVTPKAEWPERSGHVSAYEPPSSSNSFRPLIYLTGGKNSDTVLSDVWTWNLNQNETWKCDFCPETVGSNRLYDTFLSIDSPVSTLKRFILPSFDNDWSLVNWTHFSALPIVSNIDITLMEALGVKTIQDLAKADLYTTLKLRGFDHPGRSAVEVPNICYLRALSVAFLEKCAIKNPPRYQYQPLDIVRRVGKPSSIVCGRGGDSKPCEASDWDGCTPIPGISAVDIHGLGYVAVPQHEENTFSAIEEIFCRQIPSSRYFSSAVFIENRFMVLGGMNNFQLFRDVWTRDDAFPRAFIATKPESQTSQSIFLFDSNEVGANIFEYKITRDGKDVIPWTVTTKSLGVDISWLDDKKGGLGKAWYTLYVRAVDPSGNRDGRFSTHANAYRFLYVPPLPWAWIAGGIICFLLSVIGGYFEYRRRKRRATLQRFALRRLRRKFKLKTVNQEINKEKIIQEFIPSVVEAESSSRQRRRSELLDQNSRKSRRSHRHHRDGHGQRRHSQKDDRRDDRHRRRSDSRSRSKSRVRIHEETSHSEIRQRRRKKITAEDEERKRRRRDREKNRRQNIRDYGG